MDIPKGRYLDVFEEVDSISEHKANNIHKLGNDTCITIFIFIDITISMVT